MTDWPTCFTFAGHATDPWMGGASAGGESDQPIQGPDSGDHGSISGTQLQPLRKTHAQGTPLRHERSDSFQGSTETLCASADGARQGVQSRDLGASRQRAERGHRQYAKCCLDGLKDARVIDTDAKVENLHLYKRRDPANPRTELVVEAIE